MVLALILLVGGFLRLYRISEYMTFLGDEGRDVIVVRRLLVKLDPILIGPGTSIGDMYLGPLYYYLMAPALFLAGYSPVGPAVLIALLAVLTIALVWLIAREWFPSTSPGQIPLASMVAAGLYAVSPVVIVYSRSSWNPNIMPFFSLLTIYATWRIWQKHEWKWFLLSAISFAFVLQSHYLGLLLAPVISIFWLLTLIEIKKDKEKTKSFLKYSVFCLALFTLLMSPLVIFDARHGWRNFSSMKKFFLQRQTTVSARPWKALPKVWPLIEKISTRLLAGKNELMGKWTALGLVAGVIWLGFEFCRSRFEAKKFKTYFLLLIWLGFALLGLGVFKQEIYDHYYGFFFATPFLLVGAIIQKLKDFSPRAYFLSLIAFGFLIIVNLRNSPINGPPNRQLQRSQEVAAKIQEEAEGQKFNLAVIAERNYEDAYQYFLEKWDTGVIDIDPLRVDETITNQLFVVCELPKEKCDPTHNPKAEVANFGWSKIEKEWQVGGITLYQLVHTQ